MSITGGCLQMMRLTSTFRYILFPLALCLVAVRFGLARRIFDICV